MLFVAGSYCMRAPEVNHSVAGTMRWADMVVFDDMIISVVMCLNWGGRLLCGRFGCWHRCVRIEHVAEYLPAFACLFPDYKDLALDQKMLSGIEQFDSALLGYVF